MKKDRLAGVYLKSLAAVMISTLGVSFSAFGAGSKSPVWGVAAKTNKEVKNQDSSGTGTKESGSGIKNNGLATKQKGPGAVPEVSGQATLNDFVWYFDNDFPIDGTPLTELWDLGGKWKAIIKVVTPVNGQDQCRIVVSDADVQYMGYKVTLLMDVRERYQFMVSESKDMETLETADGITMVFNGDWIDDYGCIDVISANSDLHLQIYDYVEVSGKQYAMGTVLNGTRAIGEVAMIREI
ncbi:hypothetical protein [Oribacterium sp. WCC10]|uniref:hypothetical protein n=1 Tax=Oribacterium sp. WCC10 TaxID=1855343 RepID=UPI0008E8676B|nr:hypothetical protein [Oribacterium sp. WCC10]SFG06630.1 hypothetical protein SAMN05216356_10164 [Oribacterium sp. WCC10]